MKENIQKRLKAYTEKAYQNLVDLHLCEKKECLSLSRLLAISPQEDFSAQEKTHLSLCSSCHSQWIKISSKFLGDLPREHLPLAAGAVQSLSSIPSEILSPLGFPLGTSLICEAHAEGYEIRIESDIPIQIFIAFLKGDVEIYRTMASEQIPEELIPRSLVEGWEQLRFYQAPSLPL